MRPASLVSLMRLTRNCRIKRYPDGSADIVAASAPFGGGDVRREPDLPDIWEDLPLFLMALRDSAQAQEDSYAALERVAIQDDGEDSLAAQKRRGASLERAKRRARVAVRDLGLCNDFRFFVTLTLDASRIDRYDPREILRHLNRWLDNNVRRKGLKYVLVPEHHKDGAIHFHGFFNDALEAVDSGHKDRHGHTVYNLPGWGWGFSTAIELYGERAAAVAYTCKYIAKAQEKIGGRWYYSGGDLRRPEVEWCDVDFDALAGEGTPFTIDGLRGVRFVQFRTSRTYVLPGAEAGGHSEEMREASGSHDKPYPPSRPRVRSRGTASPGATPCPGLGPGMPSACTPLTDNLQESCILHFSDCQSGPGDPAPHRPRGGDGAK